MFMFILLLFVKYITFKTCLKQSLCFVMGWTKSFPFHVKGTTSTLTRNLNTLFDANTLSMVRERMLARQILFSLKFINVIYSATYYDKKVYFNLSALVVNTFTVRVTVFKLCTVQNWRLLKFLGEVKCMSYVILQKSLLNTNFAFINLIPSD